MSMLTKVIEEKQRQVDEQDRRNRIVRDANLARWTLYKASWNRVKAALDELAGTPVRVRTKSGHNGVPDVYETLPLQCGGPPNPPAGDEPKSNSRYGDDTRIRLFVDSDLVRQPLKTPWFPPPPPKRKPKGWVPPQAPLGDRIRVEIVSLVCDFGVAYWSGEKDGKPSSPNDDYAPGKKVWYSGKSDGEFYKDPGSEDDILAYVARQVAYYIPRESLPAARQAAEQRAAEAAGRPLDV